MHPVKKIVVIGPESTGKTTLCARLAEQFHSQWVPEYAREYLLAHGKSYSLEDLLVIARGQLALEDQAVAECSSRPGEGPLPLFIDTDMYVMKVWEEFVFGKCHQWILDQITNRTYDLYLLCNTDLPWVQDELREYPDPQTRETLYQIYKDIMINQDTPWVEIKGGEESRFQLAAQAVRDYIL
jgi:NadR type nicotinamide-nucleotide adenylyltransferase